VTPAHANGGSPAAQEAPGIPAPVRAPSQGRNRQGVEAPTSTPSPAQKDAVAPTSLPAPVLSEAVGYEQASDKKSGARPKGRILDRVVATAEAPESPFADPVYRKYSAGDSGIPTPVGEPKQASPHMHEQAFTGGRIPTPIGGVQSGASRVGGRPTEGVIPTPVDAGKSASLQPSTEESAVTPEASVHRAGDKLLADRDPKQPPPLVSEWPVDTKSAVEMAMGRLLGIRVPGDKLPPGDNPAGEPEGVTPGQDAGVLETLKSYVPGIGAGKGDDSPPPVSTEGAGEGRVDTRGAHDGGDAADQGGVFGTVKSYMYGLGGTHKGEASGEGAESTAGGPPGAVSGGRAVASAVWREADERVTEVGGGASRTGDFGPRPGHAVTYEPALTGAHPGRVVTIGSFSVNVGDALSLAWEMSLEAVVLVAAFAMGFLPWLRGQQATIIDMDVLDDLWADWFGPGRTPPVAIGSPEERT
jgi:hypothetical protein